MVNEEAVPNKLLIVSERAGSFTEGVRRRLEEALPEHLVVDFDPDLELLEQVGPDALIVVAGGDGTVGFVARRLIGTRHRLGVVPLGTFNNFARSLGLPTELDAAIEVIRTGSPRPVTVGRVAGRPFLEAAAVGMFGEAIVFGEAAKELRFGQLAEHFPRFATAQRFSYRITGDLRVRGRALSLVFANTPSIGAQLAVAKATPAEPYLELSIEAGGSRRDLVRRLLSALRLRSAKTESGLRFRSVRVETKPPVEVYADNQAAGLTPVEVKAVAGGLHVVLPAR